jgi:hypothetical protein
MRALIHQFEQVESRDDLLEREVKLKKLYTHLADLMLSAEEVGGSSEPPDEMLNRRLRDELVRVYAIPGGREIVERAQGEAVHRLADLKESC